MIQAAFHLTQGNFHFHADVQFPVEGVTAVFGPSGSGKTTLLRCLAGLERTPGGYLRVGDSIWQDDTRGLFLSTSRRGVGMVFQELRLFPHLTVQENLAYGWRRLSGDRRRVTMDQVVGALGLETLLPRYPHHMSGGEQQRVAIGRALLASPRLLLMDEPLASLDNHRKREILLFLRRLEQEWRIPLLFVSHTLGDILQLTRTLLLMDGGRVVAVGPIHDVLTRVDLKHFLGPGVIGAVIDTVVQAHDRVFGLTELAFGGRKLFVPIQSRALGEPLRVHVLARDVSIVVGSPPPHTSVLNIFPARVQRIGEAAADSASVDVTLDIGCALLASITRKSLATLHLSPGQQVYAQIKAVALSEEWTES